MVNPQMTTYSTYYKHQFQNDLLSFVRQIPIEGNKHYNKNEFSIQYFFLTPYYEYLDIISIDRQAYFAVALFWTILIDQVFYSHYRDDYPKFRDKTLYPKFIGNCTAPSLMSSQCGHHLNPKKILEAINDYKNIGNAPGFGREIFQKNESKKRRPTITFKDILEQSNLIMENEVRDYFLNNQSEINWEEFWSKCKYEVQQNI